MITIGLWGGVLLWRLNWYLALKPDFLGGSSRKVSSVKWRAHKVTTELKNSFNWLVVCNPCQSSLSLTILNPLRFIIISLVFFYLSKLLIFRYPSNKRGLCTWPNDSKCCDWPFRQTRQTQILRSLLPPLLATLEWCDFPWLDTPPWYFCSKNCFVVSLWVLEKGQEKRSRYKPREQWGWWSGWIKQGQRLDFKGAMQSTTAPIHISTSSTATEAETT